jgi:YgiT-type zinc finger domain-containing protein
MRWQRKVRVAGERAAECACGGRLRRELVHRYHFIDEFGRETEIHNVPAGVCERCGDAILDLPVIAEISRRLARTYSARHLDVGDLAAD